MRMTWVEAAHEVGDGSATYSMAHRLRRGAVLGLIRPDSGQGSRVWWDPAYCYELPDDKAARAELYAALAALGVLLT